MCSLTESALDPALLETKLTLSEDITCKKCRTAVSSVNLRARDTYCRPCFLLAVHHKVRATLGKHKATRPGDRVMVAASGGVNSTALLHLLQQGIESDHKKLLFVPLVVFVDEGAVWGKGVEERKENILNLRRTLGKFGFSVHVILLEDYNGERVNVYSDKDDIVFTEPLSSEMNKNFANIKESSSKQELLQQMRRSVLLEAARVLQCEKVFTGENGTVLAIELLSGVAGGAGVSLPYRVGFRDTRDCVGEKEGTPDTVNGNDENESSIKNGVTILRPMRDVSSKEVALYCTFYQLETLVGETFGTGEDSLYSIRKLTEDFLVGLQDSFPATIPTIFKTGDKLSMARVEPGDLCCLCSGPLDTGTGGHNALQATMFSSLVSAKGKGGLGDTVNREVFEEVYLEQEVNGDGCGDKTDECCGEGDGSCKTNKAPSLSLKDLSKSLCYSCRRTFGKIKSVTDLPKSIQEKIGVKTRRDQMKDEINDFLL